ncbi:MAG: cohesin domain-containing protein, partial [Saprospiraceae bacterium]
TVNNVTLNLAYNGFISNGPSITEGCGATTSTFEDNEIAGTCADDFVQIIERTWTVTDASGNSSQCVETITKLRSTLADIVFPQSLTSLPGDLPALSCGASTDPSNTGVPTLFGNAVENGGDCGFVVDFEDNAIEACAGTVKIFRTWTVTNWCTGTSATDIQLIKVADDQGPALTCPANASLSTGNDCSASYTIPTTTAVDACTGATTTVTWTADGGTLIGNTLFNAPVGVTTVTGTTSDACGNESTCTFTVTVVDQTPPVPVCDLSTVINLTSVSPTTALASSFDSGSYDNCSDVTLTVRRMNMPHCPGNDATPFGETVPFFCCDVGNVVMVELRVRDAAGNVNSCMIDAYVDDKLNPAITCPADVTLDCWEDPLDLATTGTATGTDNCSVTISSIVTGSLDECGEGTITRIWTATDPGGRTASCLQKISVINSDPFDLTDIVWPPDYNSNTCGAGLEPTDLPAPFNGPVITEDACDLVAVTHEDLYLPIVDGACVKILRTWIVIDWCQYDEDNPTAGGRWEYVQLVKVLNSADPVISSACTNETFCASNCVNGQATLTLDATDDCTPANQLNYKFIIDAFNDGGDDIVGLTNNATGVYPIGTHKITWIVEDGCGNFATCMYLFTVEDCAPPVAKCKTFAVDISDPNTQSITLGADWFDAGSFDLCGDVQNLLVQSPSIGNGQGPNPPNTASPAWTFTCADLAGADFMVVTYDLWVQDMNGNWDYCTNTITLEDNLNVCNGPQASIAGDVEVETGDQGVSDVMVYLDGGLGAAPIQTTADGNYSFIGLNPFENYTVTPQRDDTPLGVGIAGDAVTTLDIVKLGMHLLNIEYLDSPYKRIAADVDASGDISIFDMLELRKLVLHLTTEFPNNNTSWRFVPSDYTFPNYPSPFGTTFPESAPFNSLSGNVFADFVGIKVGDVNNSVIPNNLMSVPVRNTVGDLVFNVEEAQVSKGETYTVEFKAEDFNNVAGYQFTLNFDKALIDVVDVEAGDLVDLSAGNFGMSLLADGAITTSWNSTQNAELANDDVVFTVTFTAAQDLNVSEAFNISSRYTGAEAYTSALEVMNVALHFNGVVATGDFELYQNAPNPFKEETVIGFNLPSASIATLTIYDVSGKVLKVVRGEYAKGFNQINVNRSELSGTGVLYYQIDTPNHTATKKMVLIK